MRKHEARSIQKLTEAYEIYSEAEARVLTLSAPGPLSDKVNNGKAAVMEALSHGNVEITRDINYFCEQGEFLLPFEPTARQFIRNKFDEKRKGKVFLQRGVRKGKKPQAVGVPSRAKCDNRGRRRGNSLPEGQ